MAKTNYSMTSLILDKVNQEVTVSLEKVEVEDLPSTEDIDVEVDGELIDPDILVENHKINDIDPNNEQSILAEETLSEPQLSYTEFVWEGTLNDDGTSSTN